MPAKKELPKKPLIVTGMIILILAGIAFSFYLYFQHQAKQKIAGNQLGPTEVAAIINRVGQLIETPQGEIPTVASISDKNKLKDQLFFKNAQNGDKVLIFQKARRAIIYRPSTNKIVEVAPINIDTSSASQASPAGSLKPNTTEKVSVEILNGTAEAGLGSQAAGQIKNKFPQAVIGNVGNAKQSEYKKTLVVDLSGKNSDFAKDVASLLSGEVQTLPKGEEKSDADILVVLGK